MYKHISVSTYGTEWDFVSNVISQLEGCGIECLTDKEELQSAMESAATSVLPIVFKYCNFQFILQRSSTYNTNTSSYILYATHNDTKLFTSIVAFSAINVACSNVQTRSMSLTVLTNNSHMGLLVYSHNNSFCGEAFFTEVNGEVCYTYSGDSSTPAFSGNIIAIESNTLYTAVNTMPFQHNEAGKLFYVSEKMLLNGTVYVTSDNELLDCTSVTPKTLVTINDNIYYALSANTLMSIETVSE